ncbi:MAG: riboflavin synthase [Planctomycetes bacterium]|nr:riboflavin synthase [Planctomycetota bacterium]
MFTGIIQYVGRLERTTSTSAGRRLRVEVGPLAARVAHGASIAVNGVCQTVAAIDGASVEFDAVAETLRRTTLGTLAAGGRVNLEAALRVGDGLDGHIVQGHVDGIARVDRIDRGGGQHVMGFAAERILTEEMVAKGSVAIDGVSLTLVDVADGRFGVTLIPTTAAATTLGSLGVGDAVNVETDILGKYVRRMLTPHGGASGGVTLEQLRKAGFA